MLFTPVGVDRPALQASRSTPTGFTSASAEGARSLGKSDLGTFEKASEGKLLLCFLYHYRENGFKSYILLVSSHGEQIETVGNNAQSDKNGRIAEKESLRKYPSAPDS